MVRYAESGNDGNSCNGNSRYGSGDAIRSHGFRFVRGGSGADRSQLRIGCSGN
jgi:hypothetical protein